MKLIKRYVRIDKVIFDDRSFVSDHVLHICRKELEDKLMCRAFSSVEVDIAEPGTECRLMNIADVVQPTIRLDSEDATFPGVFGEIAIAGSGTTLSLDGVVVSEIMEVQVPIGCFVDMWGPATEYTELGNVWHVTFDAMPADGVSDAEYQHELHRSSKMLGTFIASLAKGERIDSEDIYCLSDRDASGLPRVAYLCGVFCQAYMTDTTVYGESMQESMPVVIHPNAVLDGAVTCRNYGHLLNADPTCVWQEHPVVKELYRRHGVDIDFAGVVLVNAAHSIDQKRRNSLMAAETIKNVFNADCCIITKEGGGNAQVDSAIALDALENDFGVKCVLIFEEFLSLNNASREQVLFSTKNADAMISTGCVMPVEVPPCSRVIGRSAIAPAPGFTKGSITPREGFIHRNRAIRGATSQLGNSWHSSIKF